MPGRRLAYPERRQITAGLAAGLTYAEIARRINRPTSTVTREISRNGGPDAYRAEPAQRATQQRARRRPPTVAPAVAPTGPDAAAIHTIGDQLVAIWIRMGLPRMVARVFTHLLLADADGHTAADLAAHLRVSPASISKAVAYLATTGLLTREREGRRERYRIEPDIWARTGAINAELDRQLAETARRGAALLGPETTPGARLTEMAWAFDNLFGIELHSAERFRDFIEYSTGTPPPTPPTLPCPHCGGAISLPNHPISNQPTH
ncbi:helix-turn-helix domain-containing protein [Nocardia sp. CDC159]|uniref:Helix-turn-helix domain-containing protein n=1 Tax=Nocardia pulmonis TaxID=2951408 RepID=A0A9X2ITW6_9NOCA|nr:MULTISPECIES: helix-turn-helix domain-containing protein [Nocardia]MCM6772222.1 helix-turn-helix domain-containing protein [Nocardia pulmonis]MCM6785120.1 helix-turn-helix domain-containing protein [Nocardia sp. CDC159]